MKPSEEKTLLQWQSDCLRAEAAVEDLDRQNQQLRAATSNEFPLYLMTEDGKSKFMPLRKAGVLADSMFSRVEIGDLVLEADFSVRKITKAEHNEIIEIADRHSDSK